MVTDIAVVGGGIVGLFTARELAQRGLQVTLLERGSLGRESSWAGAGILSALHPWTSPGPIAVLAAWSQEHYPTLAQALYAETGIDCEWIRSGLLVLGQQELRKALPWAQSQLTETTTLSARALQDLEPSLQEMQAGLLLHYVAQIRNPRLLQALRSSCVRLGVDIREHTPVAQLHIRKGHISGVETAHAVINCERVVLCAGPWTPRLVGPVDDKLPIVPVRGQMLLYHTGQPLIRHIVLCEGHYLVPRRDGHLLVGSSVEYTGFDARPTAAGGADLADFAAKLLPALANDMPKAHWAALRPGTPTGIPYISPHPAISGLFVNAGHFRNGVTLAPASARLLADLLANETPLFDPTPYAWPGSTE